MSDEHRQLSDSEKRLLREERRAAEVGASGDDDLGRSSRETLKRLTPKGGFRNKWQRQRARRRAKHVGGHDANYR